jgi:hypothetical protein
MAISAKWLFRSYSAHAIAACRHASIDPFKKFRKYYRLKVYRETYCRFLQPISMQNLDSGPAVYPPIVKKQRGRPIVKRMRKGDWKRKQKQCSTCKEHGHDKRTCRKQPVANGRSRPARDREEHSISSPSSTDSSVINCEINEQVDVEIALYDQRFQRGLIAFQRMQAIRERSPTPPNGFASQLGETTSDSELSTVSSSRFSGLDDEWWKEHQTVGCGDGSSGGSEGNNDGDSDGDSGGDSGGDSDGSSNGGSGDSSGGHAVVTTTVATRVATRSQRKRVHWE